MKLKTVYRYFPALMVCVCFLGACDDISQMTDSASSDKGFDSYNRIVRAFSDGADRRDYRLLHDWLMNDSTSTGYIRDLHIINVIEDFSISLDDRLAEVNWRDADGKLRDVIQVHTASGLRTYPGKLAAFGLPGESRERSHLMEVLPFIRFWGDTIYVALADLMPEKDSGAKTFEVSAFRIRKDSLIRLDGFFQGEHAVADGSALQCTFNSNDWSARTHSNSGNSSGILLDFYHNAVYLPVTDSNGRATDHYHAYIVDGDCEGCYQNSILENPNLCHELTGYDRLVQYTEAAGIVVRIDLMPDGTYRYASWQERNAPSGYVRPWYKPEIIVRGGKHDPVKHCYVFRNGSYTYQVPDIREMRPYASAVPSSPDIIVTRNGKICNRYTIEWYG